MRPKRLPRKINPETGTRVLPKDPHELLELLEQSNAEAMRVARATGLERDRRVALEAYQRLEAERSRKWHLTVHSCAPSNRTERLPSLPSTSTFGETTS